MPIYEYRCEPCESTFEALVRSERDVPECPSCGSDKLEKQFSVPAPGKVNGAAGAASSSLPMMPMGGCGAGGCGGGMCAM